MPFLIVWGSWGHGVTDFAWFYQLMWSPGLVRGVKGKVVPEADGHRSIDDWKSSDMDERMQNTVEGVKREELNLRMLLYAQDLL